MNFGTAIQSWHDFYMIVGTAAASLVGLLFVGLSLHLRIVVTHADVKSLARITLASLGLTLVVALFMVIPDSNSSGTGWNLFGAGVFGFVLIGRPLVAGIRSSRRALSFGHLMLRFGLTGATFVAVLVGGLILVGGNYDVGLSWFVGASVALLVGALRNSWDLLVSVGDATMGHDDPPSVKPA